MNTINKEGVIYTRVSSLKQVTEGHGLDSQYSACMSYANENNIEVIKSFQDRAYSGKTTDRPGLEKLISFLRKRKTKTMVIFDTVDRLSRNTEDYFFLKMKIKEYGGFLISLNDDLESSNPIDQLKETMVVAFADYDRKRNLQRVNSRMRERVKAGYWLHKPPVGMLFKDKILVPDESNSKLIKKIYEDFALGRYISLSSIKESPEAQQLINMKTGKPYKLSVRFIRFILTNKLYIGIIDYPNWGLRNIAATHKGFIDKDIFDQVQKKIKGKIRKTYSFIKADEFPLKGDLECSSCSKKLTANFSKGRSKKYPYYRCDSSQDICDLSPKNIPRDTMHTEFLGLLKNVRIKKEVLKLADKIMEDTFSKRSNHHKAIRNQNKSKIEELEKRKALQLDKLLITSNRSVVKALEDEIESIDRQTKALQGYEVRSDDMEDFKLQAQILLSKPDKAWVEADMRTKKIIFDFVFEDSLKICDGKIGTAKFSLPYRLMSQNVKDKKHLVEPRGIEPLTSTLPALRSPS